MMVMVTICYDLIQEYNDQKTPEAIVVKDIDRFEMILQAFEYEVGKHWCTLFFTFGLQVTQKISASPLVSLGEKWWCHGKDSVPKSLSNDSDNHIEGMEGNI